MSSSVRTAYPGVEVDGVLFPNSIYFPSADRIEESPQSPEKFIEGLQVAITRYNDPAHMYSPEISYFFETPHEVLVALGEQLSAHQTSLSPYNNLKIPYLLQQLAQVKEVIQGIQTFRDSFIQRVRVVTRQYPSQFIGPK